MILFLNKIFIFSLNNLYPPPIWIEENMKLPHNNSYIYQILWDGKICRWDKNILLVYINYNQVGPHIDKKKLKERIENSFYVWENVLDGKIKFKFITTDHEKSDIYIDFQRNNFDGTIGLCSTTKNPETNTLTKAYITLGLIWTQYFDQNTIHEIGHALGFAGHSTNRLDIMYDTLTPCVKTLSTRDINTIRAFYELPIGSDYNYIQANIPQINTDFNTKTISKDYETQNIKPLSSKDLTEEITQIALINIIKINQTNINLSTEIENYCKAKPSSSSWNNYT